MKSVAKALVCVVVLVLFTGCVATDVAIEVLTQLGDRLDTLEGLVRELPNAIPSP